MPTDNKVWRTVCSCIQMANFLLRLFFYRILLLALFEIVRMFVSIVATAFLLVRLTMLLLLLRLVLKLVISSIFLMLTFAHTQPKFLFCLTSFWYLITYSIVQSPSWEANWHVPNFIPLCILRDASPRNTPPRRSEWGSSLPPDCSVARGRICL
jgi:hypothetical protein